MKKKGCLSLILKITGVLLLLLVLLLGGIATYNSTMPEASSVVVRLSEQEKARIREITHLRNTLGDKVWPGWSTMNIPIVLYNEKYAFLSGIQEPASGWERVPSGMVEGGEWKTVPDESYYRQPLPINGGTPQAFIVAIGDSYAASMTTKEWTSIHLVDLLQKELPGFLTPVFPYFIFINRFNSDWFISAVLHESFHVLQAQKAYQRLEEAEQATVFEEEYPWGDDEFRALWLDEREKLAAALGAEGSLERRRLVKQWSALRNKRREQLSADLIRYERQREWLEGLAKYAELNIWYTAYETPGYTPVPAMKEVPDFKAYRDAREHRSREISQLRSDLQFSESMFYYTGWAQAELLDNLNVNGGWKEEVMNSGIYLDELLLSQ